MGRKDKKLAVLLAIKNADQPQSLQELRQKLDKPVADRTLRRWISELVSEGLIEKIGSKRSTRYQACEKEAIDTCFSKTSEKVLAQVRRPLHERAPIAYESGWIAKYKPNQSFYIPQKTRETLQNLGKRSKNEDPAGTYAHQVYNRLLIDLSYNSSRLEGNTYSLLDTQKLVLEGEDAQGKLDEEKVMILNHKEAIRYLVDHSPNLSLNLKTVCTVHYLLSDGLVESKYSGKVRDCGARIGGSTYIPYENPDHLKKVLNQIVEKADLIEDPFEQSFFLLVHISYLQAFIDVNKRTARLLSNIPFIQKNFVPLSFNDIDKDDYISALLSIYELQDTRPLLDLFVFSYTRTCASYDATIKAIGFDELRVRYRAQRRLIIRDIILQNLHGKQLHTFLNEQAKKQIRKEDIPPFLEDVLEDLEQLDPSRLVGLGITSEELAKWLKKRTV